MVREKSLGVWRGPGPRPRKMVFPFRSKGFTTFYSAGSHLGSMVRDDGDRCGDGLHPDWSRVLESYQHGDSETKG